MGEADPGRYTVLGHRGMSLWHPHDPGAIEGLIDAVGLDAGGRALDVGCGQGEVALRIAARTGAGVRGVDASALAIGLARASAEARGLEHRVEWVCAPFDPAVESPVDLVVCVGSLHVVGGLEGALVTLGPRVAPGGCLLVGDGFWAAEPDPTWLDRRFGGDRSAFRRWAEIEACCAEAGWRPRASHRVSAAGWLAYETRHNANIRAVEADDAAQLRARSDGWFEDWKRWGAALGFGLWLLERGRG